MMTTNHSCLFSPKRKREPSESDYYSPSASPTSTISLDSFQEARLREEVELGRHSPRAAVAGRFGELAIRGERRPLPCRFGGHPNDLSATTGESPEAQDSHPLVSLTQEDITKAPATPIASPSLKKLASSPHKKSNPTSPSKSRKKRLSPPLAGDSLEDPFTWHDSEITGHNPTDPTDDGYGINGVGFKPTAAMAWARSQKRQKQVAEWKNREAREARERRRERRNEAINMDKIHSIQQGAINKRVKFDV
ncbi:hypothetical protein N7512_009744 [Penicillium capsulatum]|nr:hypothetical protein N7512_009744 [Penicillium capsulatum]